MTLTFPGVVHLHASSLEAGIEHGTRISMHEAIKRAYPHSPQEPDVVAMLALEGVVYFANSIQSVLAPYGLRVSIASVYCHQKPTVRFNGTGCELGDVLFVHRHTAASNVVVNRALLLQAKLTSKGQYTVPGSERTQLALYTGWPKFTYARAGALINGQSRDVTPKHPHAGAQYLLIDDLAMGLARSGLLGFAGTHCMAVSPASRLLTTSNSFARELVRLLGGAAGRDFIDHASADASGWSQVVWDLLALAQSAVFKRKRIGLEDYGRLAGSALSTDLEGACALISADGSASWDAGSVATFLSGFVSDKGLEPPHGSLEVEGEGDGGPSLIVIETSVAGPG